MPGRGAAASPGQPLLGTRCFPPRRPRRFPPRGVLQPGAGGEPQPSRGGAAGAAGLGYRPRVGREPGCAPPAVRPWMGMAGTGCWPLVNAAHRPSSAWYLAGAGPSPGSPGSPMLPGELCTLSVKRWAPLLPPHFRRQRGNSGGPWDSAEPRHPSDELQRLAPVRPGRSGGSHGAAQSQVVPSSGLCPTHNQSLPCQES